MPTALPPNPTPHVTPMQANVRSYFQEFEADAVEAEMADKQRDMAARQAALAETRMRLMGGLAGMMGGGMGGPGMGMMGMGPGEQGRGTGTPAATATCLLQRQACALRHAPALCLLAG